MKPKIQKSLDVAGILLDCKAFYIAFCELEKHCRIPFGDLEKMNLYHEKNDAEKTQFLTPTMVTNGIFAAELALKALTLKETGAFDYIHEIDKLFYALPIKHKEALSKLVKIKTHQSDATLKCNLETISSFFVDWRYWFEKDDVGYSNFLLEFIHIVCDYALNDSGI